MAYLRTTEIGGITSKDALVVRDLTTGAEKAIPIPPNPVGTPPDRITNWSPDSRTVALYSEGVQLVDTKSGTVTRAPTARYWVAPVYMSEAELVVLTNCCIRAQRFSTVDLISGVATPFTKITAPPESLLRIAGGFMVVDALGRLTVVSRKGEKVVLKRVARATT